METETPVTKPRTSRAVLDSWMDQGKEIVAVYHPSSGTITFRQKRKRKYTEVNLRCIYDYSVGQLHLKCN